MQIPLQINFQNMDPSPAIEARIREKAAKLEQFHDRIIGCKVVVEAPHRHHHKGKLYNVRIDISVPGKDVFVGHSGPLNHAHEDVYVAIRDAFNAAGRQLEDHVRRMRGAVKAHAAPAHDAGLRPARTDVKRRIECPARSIQSVRARSRLLTGTCS
jgi:ribosomal subunit interface protein